MIKVLILINDAPYGTEKAYNALRAELSTMKELTLLTIECDKLVTF
jgi:sulfur relay (sulfurtransferase) complex TusBCD TusD component (DsrE family)